MNPTRQHVWDKTDGRCFYCGLHLEDDGVPVIRGGGYAYTSWMDVDHVHPRSKGGLDSVENMVPSCQSCNCTKANKTLEEYRHHLALKADGRPKMTVELVDWLTEHGFQFPPIENHVFWFEKNGLALSRDVAVLATRQGEAA